MPPAVDAHNGCLGDALSIAQCKMLPVFKYNFHLHPLQEFNSNADANRSYHGSRTLNAACSATVHEGNCTSFHFQYPNAITTASQTL